MENINNKILLTNIQRFSLHDGPGIRTTVFLKGCSLRCPWCSNPENLLPTLQTYERDGVTGIYGKWYEVDELVEECLKDKNFYEGELSSENWNIVRADQIDSLPGGVTFSGGESLLQIKQLIPVCKKLHKNGIHIAVETCLFVPRLFLQYALDYIDFFYVDVKILEKAKCEQIEHGCLDQYLKNLEILMRSGKPVVMRIPVIGKYTDDIVNRKAVKRLLQNYRPLKVELIKEHALAESKYESLNLKMNYHGVSDSMMKQYKDELVDLEIPIEICKV